MLAFACLALSTVLGRVASVTVSTPLAVSMVPATHADENSERSIPRNDRTEEVVDRIAFFLCLHCLHVL